MSEGLDPKGRSEGLPREPARRGHPEGKDHMLAVRRTLPPTRRSVTHKFSISGHEGYLTIGLDERGEPGEIFIKMSKEGSTLSGMAQAFCRAFSIAIQYGLPLEDAVTRFRGMRFEPMGMTSNPDVPEASSIVDYVARYLAHEFLGEGSENR